MIRSCLLADAENARAYLFLQTLCSIHRFIQLLLTCSYKGSSSLFVAKSNSGTVLYFV